METSEDPLPSVLLANLADLPISFYIMNVLLIAGLLFLSGLISGSEVAFFSLSRDEINKEGKNGKRIADLLGNPRRLLATILILNNLVNLFIITISTFFTWSLVGKESGGGVLVLLTTLVTLLLIFFGEIIPKVYANSTSKAFASRTSGLLYYSDKVLKPLSWFLMSLSGVIEKRIQKKGYSLSVDELHQALELTTVEETTEEEKGMLKGIVNFGTLTVKQVMRSRMDITAFDKETDFHELMDLVNKTGYSRIPIYTESVDKIDGILYIKDLLPHLEKEEDFAWQDLIRPGVFVPESKRIDDLFKDFQDKRVHMAIVVDEYGGTEGLITLEDIIEEIVGEINDEFDEGSEITYNKLDPNTYVFEAKTSLNDFCKVTELDPQFFDETKGESESIGGLLLEINQKLPNAGEKIKYKNLHFTTVAVDQKRIKRVRVYIDSEKSGIAGEFED